MPYKSKAQLRFMHARHPKIAARWDKEYGVSRNLPERVKPRDKRTSRAQARKRSVSR